MTGNTGYIKKFVLILLFMSVSGFFLLSGSGQYDQSLNDINAVQKKIRILKKISNAYKYDRAQLGKSKTEMEIFRYKAARAILSNVGVVMFKGMADVIQNFFDTPGPDGLLQDLLQEMLFENEPEPEEKELIQFWMKRNFLRRKNLTKIYTLLERVLRAPLERFELSRESFPNTEDLWKGAEGEPDSYLKRITRRLNVIVHVLKELSGRINKEIGDLKKDRGEVENEIKRLRSEKEPPEATETGNLDKNGKKTE